MLKNIQNADIPFRRDCWRAASWINTSNNRFFYQTIKYGKNELKLPGCRGNNETKQLLEIPVNNDLKMADVQSCQKTCASNKNIKINNIDYFLNGIEYKTKTMSKRMQIETFPIKKLDNLKRDYIKPGPLCKKSSNRSSVDLEFGKLEVLTLPTVQLEVCPEIGRSLPDSIKPYLKQMLPETNIITPEWANFAVSVVKLNTNTRSTHRRKYKKPESKSFVFDIPYENNQKKILVRRRRIASKVMDKQIYEDVLPFYEENNKSNWEFSKTLNQSDRIEVECANILSDIIESVAITVNENNFIKNDSDIDYIGKLVPIKDEKISLAIKPACKSNEKSIKKVDRNARMM